MIRAMLHAYRRTLQKTMKQVDEDHDGTFETTDEQPAFSAAALDGPGSPIIRVQVTDRAGRTATGQATVNVSNQLIFLRVTARYDPGMKEMFRLPRP